MRIFGKISIQTVATVVVAGFALGAYLIYTDGKMYPPSSQEVQSTDSTWLTEEMVESAAQRDEETIVLAEKSAAFADALTLIINEEGDQDVDVTEFFSEGAVARHFSNGVIDRKGLQTFLNLETEIDHYELEAAAFSPNPNTGEENTLAGVRLHLHYFDQQSLNILLWEKNNEVWKIEGVMNMVH